MDLKEINKKIRSLSIPENDKDTFLDLIKIKTDSDMDKVINAINTLKAENNANIGALKAENNANIGALNSKIDNIKWFIGGAIGLATAIAGIIALIVQLVK